MTTACTPSRIHRDRALMARGRELTALDRRDSVGFRQQRHESGMYRDTIAADYRQAERKAWQALADVHADFAARYEAMQADALADEHHQQACAPMGTNARGVAQCDSGHGDFPDACQDAS